MGSIALVPSSWFRRWPVSSTIRVAPAVEPAPAQPEVLERLEVVTLTREEHLRGLFRALGTGD